MDADMAKPLATVHDETYNWLKKFPPFDALGYDATHELLSASTQVSVEAGETIAKEGEAVQSVYIIRSGFATVTSSGGASRSLKPGDVCGWMETFLGQVYQCHVVASSRMELLKVTSDVLQFNSCKSSYQRQYNLGLARYMAKQLEELEEESKDSSRRLQAMTPYLVSAPKCGIVGNSSYADRLRKQVVAASRDVQKRPVLIFGERGLEKANTAALIHFGSFYRKKPMVAVNADRLDARGVELFGRGDKPGLLDLLQEQGGGTLLINNVNELPSTLIPRVKQLFEEKTYQHQLLGMAMSDNRKASDVRVVMTAEKPCPQFDPFITVIKVPPLRVRPSDVKDLVRYTLSVMNKLPVNNSGGNNKPSKAAAAPSSSPPDGTTTTNTAAALKVVVEEAGNGGVAKMTIDTGRGDPATLASSSDPTRTIAATTTAIFVSQLSSAKAPDDESKAMAEVVVAGRTTSPFAEAFSPGSTVGTSTSSGSATMTSLDNCSSSSSSSSSRGAAVQRQKTLLSDAALKRLLSYTWPGNIKELRSAVERATVIVDQTEGGGASQLPEEVFWSAMQGKDRFRWNLLSSYPLLKDILRSEFWPDGLNFKFTAYVYPVLVALLLWGPQDRDHNFVLNFFWAWWWPLSFVAFLFLGRVWCAVCPFMIYGELVQKWRIASGASLMKWPREMGEEYGPWFLLSLFAGILIWEEVWDLPNTASLSGWLLILITVGAMVCSAIFERRYWCRYLCPIGGMNGMFAKLSMTELRARQGVCSGECSTYHCYKGGCAVPPEGLESVGCPLYSHPAQLTDNRHCVNCMECLKACPHS
ncbi:hypothetical protein CEUSTIGMA_g7875.t1, partial [Chlamydomonas eustigma]